MLVASSPIQRASVRGSGAFLQLGGMRPGKGLSPSLQFTVVTVVTVNWLRP